MAFALLARLLGPETRHLADAETTEALRTALMAAGEDVALGHLTGADDDLPDVAQLAGRWVRWFDLGRVAPYEGSHVTATAGGVTPRLADIAGFYRAFNLAVSGERPDHVVAQLEFLAVTLLAEAEALERHDHEHAEITAAATRSFLRDHVGGWLDAWAARIGSIEDLAPWFPYAAAAAILVSREAARRNVVPLRDTPVLPADAGIPDDDEPVLTCGEEPADLVVW